MTITEFLLARIAEDEEIARAATQGEWRTGGLDPLDPDEPRRVGVYSDLAYPGVSVMVFPEYACDGSSETIWNDQAWHDGRHVAYNNPARVLAECEAKRRIVEREEADMRAEWRRRSDEHRRTWEQWLSEKGSGEMLTLRDLASVYADHPDFDPAWRVAD